MTRLRPSQAGHFDVLISIRRVRRIFDSSAPPTSDGGAVVCYRPGGTLLASGNRNEQLRDKRDDLRHTHALLLIHEGVDPKIITERLGHSSIKLTMDTYGHRFEGSDQDSAEKMDKLFSTEPTALRLLTMPDRSRIADKTADKNTKASLLRASK